MTGGGFTIRGLSLRSVVVPMARPLVEALGGKAAPVTAYN